MMARIARENDDGSGILLCIAECVLGCLASIMEYFNKVRRSNGQFLTHESHLLCALNQLSHINFDSQPFPLMS
jgi:hypothetical protein